MILFHCRLPIVICNIRMIKNHISWECIIIILIVTLGYLIWTNSTLRTSLIEHCAFEMWIRIRYSIDLHTFIHERIYIVFVINITTPSFCFAYLFHYFFARLHTRLRIMRCHIINRKLVMVAENWINGVILKLYKHQKLILQCTCV